MSAKKFDVEKLSKFDFVVYTNDETTKKDIEKYLKSKKIEIVMRETHYLGKPYQCFVVPFSAVLYFYENMRNKCISLYRQKPDSPFGLWMEGIKGGGTGMRTILKRVNIRYVY